MSINPPIQRIIRSKIDGRIYIRDLNIRLDNSGDTVSLFNVEDSTNKYYRTLEQLTNSQDLDQAITLGWVEVIDENGRALSKGEWDRATFGATLWDINLYGGGSSGSSSTGFFSIYDEGSLIGTQFSKLDFIGSTITAADAGSNRASITITGGGASQLTDLTDFPNSYTGYNLYGLRVNNSGTGVEFFDIANTYSNAAHTHAFITLTDTPNSYISQANKIVRVNSGETGVEFIDGTTIFQSIDTTLTALAGLSTSADQMIYSTGSDAFSMTSLTSFARTLLDDANQAAAQSTLGVDPAGTDNSTDVTLAGSYDYITISGQQITRNQIDLTTDATGALPTANGGTGLSGATPFTANGIVYASSASALATASDFIWDGDNLGIGTTPSEKLHISASGAAGARIVRSDATASGSYIDQYKSRGSVGSESAVTDNDFVFLNRAYAYQNSAYQLCGYYAIRVDGTPSVDNVPTEFFIQTNNGSALDERFRISGDGSIIFKGLTSNGFVKTSGGTGTLSVDTTSYQTLDATLTSLASYDTNGLLTQTATDAFTGRTITGTSNKIDVADGNGVAGNPTITISSTYAGQTSITTLGTIGTGTWSATEIGVLKGGTGLTGIAAGSILAANTLNTLSAITSASGLKVLQNSTGTTSWATTTGTGNVVYSTSPGFTTAANPATSDGAALGTSSLMWSDLFLADGSVINFNSGNITLTHSAGILTFNGGTLALGSNPLTMTTGYIAIGANAAGSGVIRLENAATIAWEASPASTDVTLTVNSSEVLSSSAPISATTGFQIGGSATTGTILRGNGTNYVASTATFSETATANKILVGDGTNWVTSTSTIPVGTLTASRLLYSSSTSAWSQTSNLTWDEATLAVTSGSITSAGIVYSGSNIIALSSFRLGSLLGSTDMVLEYSSGDLQIGTGSDWTTQTSYIGGSAMTTLNSYGLSIGGTSIGACPINVKLLTSQYNITKSTGFWGFNMYHDGSNWKSTTASQFGSVIAGNNNSTNITIYTSSAAANASSVFAAVRQAATFNADTSVVLSNSTQAAGCTIYGAATISTDLTVSTNVLFCSSSGSNVGVGTASPNAARKFDVVQAATSNATNVASVGTCQAISSGTNGTVGLFGDTSGGTSTNSGSHAGVYGRTQGSAASGTFYGVRGSNISTATSSTQYGVYGESTGATSTGTKYGVYGTCTGTGTTNYGVYGIASGGTTNWSGFFDSNVGIGTSAAVGTSGTRTLAINIGTEPSSSPANCINIYAKDSSAGSANATLALRTEQAVETVGTFTASHKLRIWINGTQYWIQLDAV